MKDVQAAIEARAITNRTRAGQATIRDISMTVGHGELVGIIGSIGSGKAALLDALSGLHPPTTGTVLRPPNQRIGYVPAGDSIDPALPLHTALRYTAALRGVHGLRADAGGNGTAVGDALSLVGLTAEAASSVGALNPGARKRAAIAAELVPGPTALFLDDPTAALDPAQATQVMRLLRRLASGGTTVLLTTSSPRNAARCDKVAVLAVGGHLAFFGTPAAARGYFGADSLEEIYERLSGLSDPTAAWSRRFFYPAAAASSAPVPTTPRAPGPALLIPDQAGPHSAGRPGVALTSDWHFEDPSDDLEPARAQVAAQGHGNADGTAASPHPTVRAATGASVPEPRRQACPAKPLGLVAQLPVLVRRNADILRRARHQQAIMAAVPLAAGVVLCGLLGAGALNGPAAVTLAWAILAGLATGLAYELPMRGPEAGVLRRERFTTLSTPAFMAAKAALLLPALAVADAIIAVVPAVANRLQAGLGISYLAVFLASTLGLAAATAPASASRHRYRE